MSIKNMESDKCPMCRMSITHQRLTNVTINGSVRKVYDLGGRLLSFQYSNTVKGKSNRKYIISCEYSRVLAMSTRAPKIQTQTRTSIFPRVTRTRESGYSRVFPRFYSQVLAKYLESWSALPVPTNRTYGKGP